MRTGVRLGIDVGEVRVGVARCDPAGILAVPAETIRVSPDGPGPVLDRLEGLLEEVAADSVVREVIVGLPRVLSGGEGIAADKARAFAAELERRIRPIPVRLVDERLSTVSALAGFRAGGVSTRKSRSRVDQAAAAVILQGALDTERASGAAPGELVGA